jgi:AcrR family transcriptional regulator
MSETGTPAVASAAGQDSPAGRIVAAASRCFATKGYSGTTIADIEREAGYSPRAGGIYRHFASKQVLLEAVIDAAVTDNEAVFATVEPPPEPVTPASAAEFVVRNGLRQLDRQAELMNIVFRDLDQFPHLVAKVRDGLANATVMLARLFDSLAPEPIDSDALAAVAVGPTIDFKIKQHMLGFTPLGITEDRFVAAWVTAFTPFFEGAGTGNRRTNHVTNHTEESP